MDVQQTGLWPSETGLQQPEDAKCVGGFAFGTCRRKIRRIPEGHQFTSLHDGVPMKKLALLLILVALPALGANHYIRAGATGNGSGTDWTNACSGFSGSCAISGLVRGDTYYVADGSYGSQTFDTANSGSSVITIIKATVANHGTATGWSDTFGDGQAVF